MYRYMKILVEFPYTPYLLFPVLLALYAYVVQLPQLMIKHQCIIIY